MPSITYNKILWDKEKNEKLKAERGISFEDIQKLIREDKIIVVISHYNLEKYPNQKVMVFRINNYIHLVPFYISEENNLILITIFASRKYNKIYGESD